MKVQRYEFASGAVFQGGAKGDPNIVGAHIDFLRQQQKGELQPQDVLHDARNPNSPLHGFFEWSDTKAAEQYRLQQARGLIRAVVAVYRPNEEEPKTVATRAFVHIAEKGAPHYRATHEAMATKSSRDAVLRQAWNELQSWRRRYADLKQLADVFDAIDAAAKQIHKPAA